MEEKLGKYEINGRIYIVYVDDAGEPVKGDGPNGLKIVPGTEEKGYSTQGHADTALKEAGGVQSGGEYYDPANPPGDLDNKMIAYYSGQIDQSTFYKWMGGKGPAELAMATWEASNEAYSQIQNILNNTSPSPEIIKNLESIPAIKLKDPPKTENITAENTANGWVLYDNVRGEVISKAYPTQSEAEFALKNGKYQEQLTAQNIHQQIVGAFTDMGQKIKQIREAQDVFSDGLSAEMLIKNFKDGVPGYTLDKLFKTLLLREDMDLDAQGVIDYLIASKVLAPGSSWTPPEVNGEKPDAVVPGGEEPPEQINTAVGQVTGAQSNINPVTGQPYPSPVGQAQPQMQPAIAGTKAEGTMVPTGTLTPVQKSVVPGTEEYVPTGTLTPVSGTAITQADPNLLAQFDTQTTPPAGTLTPLPASPPPPAAGVASIGQLAATAGYDPKAVQTLYDAAAKAGFTGEALHRAVATALAESGGKFEAENRSALGVQENSMGAWQINLDAHADKVPGATFEDKVQWLKDPYNAAQIAFQVSSGGTDFSPWSVWLDKYGKPAASVFTQLSQNKDIVPPPPAPTAGEATPSTEGGLNLIPFTPEDETATAAADYDKQQADAKAAFDAYANSLGTRVFRTTPTSGFYYDGNGRQVPISYVPERGRVEAGQPGAPSQAARAKAWEEETKTAGQYPLTPEQTASIASLSIADQASAVQQMLGLDYMPGPTEVNAILGTSSAWVDQYPFMTIEDRLAATEGPDSMMGNVNPADVRANFQKAAEEAYPGDPIRQRQFVETNMASRQIADKASQYVAGYGFIGNELAPSERSLLEGSSGTYGFNAETGNITKTVGVGGFDPETGQPMTQTSDISQGDAYLASLEQNTDPNAILQLQESWRNTLSSAASALRAKDSSSALRILGGLSGRIVQMDKLLDELGIFGPIRSQLMQLYGQSQQPAKQGYANRGIGGNTNNNRPNTGSGISRPDRPDEGRGPQPQPLPIPQPTPPPITDPSGPFTTPPIMFAEGGTMQVSQPTALVDMQSQQTLGIAGEAGPESINITPNSGQPMAQPMAQPMMPPPMPTKTLPQQGIGGIKASPSMKGILSQVAEQYRMRLQLVGTSPLLAQELARQRMQTPAGQARLIKETSQPIM